MPSSAVVTECLVMTAISVCVRISNTISFSKSSDRINVLPPFCHPQGRLCYAVRLVFLDLIAPSVLFLICRGCRPEQSFHHAIKCSRDADCVPALTSQAYLIL